jgi:glutamyl-tRNA synthetase
MMIKTRFSPSPTGLLHLGNVRAALFSALFAAKSKGHFILRIEDTDAARSDEKFTHQLQDDLHWLGLDWQEGPQGGPHGPYFQSKRHDIYDTYYKKLIEENRAYPCFCTEQELALNRKLQLSRGQAPRYPGTCRKLTKEEVDQKISEGKKPALRFRVPDDEVIGFVDLVKEQQRFDSFDIGDFIIRRADGSSSFMFCNAIDDSLMEITHVIRGEDHLTNTPRQLMILHALKMRTAEYGHLSLILGDDGSPLSKRHGSFSLHDLREQGYLPHAVMNYLARLSHAYDSQELMSFSDLAEKFSLEKLSRAPARFDKNQLLHWQKEAVMKLSDEALWKWLGDDLKNKIPAPVQTLFADMMRKNILFPTDAKKWAEIFFADVIALDAHSDVLKQAGAAFFQEAKLSCEKNGDNLKNIFDDLKTKLNVSGKNLFMPFRIALTGEMHGPELQPIATLMGAEKMRDRFERVMALINK